MKKIPAGLLALTPLLFGHNAFAADFNVKTSQELTDALVAAAASSESDTIILAPGVYKTIEGPFAYYADQGGNLTIRSEDPDNKAILDGQSQHSVLTLEHTNSDLAYNEVDTTQFVLKDLIIENGVTESQNRAGGLWAKGADVTIEGSTLRFNSAKRLNPHGAAIYFIGGRENSISLINSTITGNNPDSEDVFRGEVIHVYQGSSLNISDGSIIKNNNSSAATIVLRNTPSKITSSHFENNSTTRGVINPGVDLIEITASTFKNNENTSSIGAGVLSFGNYRITDSTFEGNMAEGFSAVSLNNYSNQFITNSRFIDNRSNTSGTIGLGSDSFSISNTLFKGNAGEGDGGHIYCGAVCDVEVVNSIFDNNTGPASVWSQNRDASGVVVANSIFLGSSEVISFRDDSARATVTNSFLSNAIPSLKPQQTLQPNNSNIRGSDPWSGNGFESDYELIRTSLLVDAGTTDPSLVTLPEIDIRGNARVFGDSVDIGWEELDSSMTVPVINSFSLLTERPTNLKDLEFNLDVDTGEDYSISSVQVKTDEEDQFVAAAFDGEVLSNVVVMEGGVRTITVKVTNNNQESASQSTQVNVQALSALEVLGLCENDPELCNISISQYEQEAAVAAIAGCKENVTDCLTAEEAKPFIDQGYTQGFSAGNSQGFIEGRVNGISFCKENPTSDECGIDIGEFDSNLIPSMGDGNWQLFGTGQEIDSSQLSSKFAEAQIVWSLKNGEWQAWAADDVTNSSLSGAGVPSIDSIPANTGFWIKK